jgi:hypothetical protein
MFGAILAKLPNQGNPPIVFSIRTVAKVTGIF